MTYWKTLTLAFEKFVLEGTYRNEKKTRMDGVTYSCSIFLVQEPDQSFKAL